jgi:hypothetical protein
MKKGGGGFLHYISICMHTGQTWDHILYKCQYTLYKYEMIFNALDVICYSQKWVASTPLSVEKPVSKSWVAVNFDPQLHNVNILDRNFLRSIHGRLVK